MGTKASKIFALRFQNSKYYQFIDFGVVGLYVGLNLLTEGNKILKASTGLQCSIHTLNVSQNYQYDTPKQM